MELTGKSVFGGIAIGNLSLYRKNDNAVKRVKVEDPEVEINRFEEAKETAKAQLGQLYDKAMKEVGEANAAVFEVHQMMLDDLDYIESVQNMIRSQGINAEFAVATTGDNFSEMFAAMDDDYMKARAADVKDISNRVVAVLQGGDQDGFKSDEPVIIIAEDLAPSETVQLDKSKVLSFVTRGGSTNSHTAILARTMNIPALIGVDFDDAIDGKFAIVDGFAGKLIVEPEEDVLAVYRKKQEEEREKLRLLQELKGKENVTLDGTKVNLYANIGGVKDVMDVLKNDAGGIGLFRSEFLYLESNDYPSEEAQFKAYRTVAENMAGKKVIIRTLDIGADKQVDYFQMEKEENPALGYRAIRICLDRVEVFKTQLRAIYRASYYGKISVMYPMIISVDEVRRIKEIVEEVKKELDEQGAPYGEVETGIMIETPAAVFMSEELAKEVDFFSIGTNDLTQYTLACDRQNAKLDGINDPHHPAVLRAIEMTIKNGHKGGAWVGICGELG
ncbi:MAG: phosphoenolpyruvate--protein phosphotransferase, partial [Lachnospiraceae bacterium]|nr:phosphoenolpyruvate--protein phosphotransferase [Lachnospiraceae bacterium]